VSRDSKFIVDDAEIAICVGMLVINSDGALQSLLAFIKAAQLNLADSDLIQEGGVPGRVFQRGLVVVHSIEIVLILA